MKSIDNQHTTAVTKGVELFLALVEGQSAARLSDAASRAGIPLSTAHRLAAVYLRSGLLARVGHGRYAAGPRLAAITLQRDTRALFAAASRPKLRRLAKHLDSTVHLGILEDGMVTYLVKEHGGGEEILTREMNQLEGYGSAIGKTLLAHLGEAEQEAYLANGPFVPLTTNTITSPAALRAAFLEIRAEGYAFDNAEVDNDLFCLAVPVFSRNGEVRFAISVSRRADSPVDLAQLKPLRDCAAQISSHLSDG